MSLLLEVDASLTPALLWLFCDAQDYLSSSMTILAHFLCPSSFSKGKHCSHDWFDASFIDDRCDSSEIFSARLAHDMFCAHTMRFCGPFRNIGYGGHEESARLQRAPRPFEGILTDGVQYHVHIMYDIFELLGLVVYDFISAYAPQELRIAGGSCADDVCSLLSGELNCEASDSTGGTMD